MQPLTLLYRDPDRTPYLFALKHAAQSYGLEVRIERAGREYGELLVDESSPILVENYYALQALRARGAPIVSLATSITWMNERLFVDPGIESIDELKGKTFAIRGIQSSELIERLWLKEHGLERIETRVYSDQDVGRWRQWTKVRDGECQGCLITDLYADAARDAGLKEIPFEPFGYLGNVTLTTHIQVVERDRAAAEALVRSAFDASRMFKEEPNTVSELLESQELQPLIRHFHGERSLDRICEVLREELPDYPVPSVEGLGNMRRAAMRSFPELADFNPLLMWDLSFARTVADERGGPRLGIYSA